MQISRPSRVRKSPCWIALLLLAFTLPATASGAELPIWRTLPPTPTLPNPLRTGVTDTAGGRLWWAQFGNGRSAVLLHGGLANSNYFGHLVPALVAAGFQVTVVDSRGHGRSTRSSAPLSYHAMADDILVVLDSLRIQRADLIGWSDGGNIGLDLAMHHPERVHNLIVYGANSDSAGTLPDAASTPTFSQYLKRVEREYRALSPTPDAFVDLEHDVERMWEAEPRWTTADLGAIRVRTLVSDGEHEEAIRHSHTIALAKAIPEARLTFLAEASHFGMLQTPAAFNAMVLKFLAIR